MHSASIIVPTFNALGQVEGLLTHLKHFHEKYCENCEVIVTDDASTDGTAAEIHQLHPWIKVVANQQNQGFGANVMCGVKLATKDYLVVLNTDIDFIGNPFLALFDALELDDSLFAVMPLVFNRAHDKVENLQCLSVSRGLAWNTDLPEAAEWTSLLKELLAAAGSFKERLRDIAKATKPIPSLLCGALFACKRERFNALGGFDPRYRPFYWEDVALDYTARLKGWRCVVLPSACVIHRHSETIDRHFKSRKQNILMLNQLRFVLEHHEQLPGMSQRYSWWGLRALREVFRGNPELAGAYLRAGAGFKVV